MSNYRHPAPQTAFRYSPLSSLLSTALAWRRPVRESPIQFMWSHTDTKIANTDSMLKSRLSVTSDRQTEKNTSIIYVL